MRLPIAIGILLACVVAGSAQTRVQPRQSQSVQQPARKVAPQWLAADDDGQPTPTPRPNPTPQVDEEPEPAPFEPRIDGPSTARAGRKVVLRVVDADDLDSVSWVFPSAVDEEDLREVSSDSRAAYLWLDGGQYDIAAVVSRSALKPGMRPQTVTLRHVIELTAPQPPPGPAIDPDEPPGPPDVAPVPSGDLRVLMLYDAYSALTREQLNILHSTEITGILNDRCVKVAGRSEWRKWDKDIDRRDGLAGESDTWRKILDSVKADQAKPGASKLPVIVIVRGTAISIQAFPPTEAATIELLRGLK